MNVRIKPVLLSVGKVTSGIVIVKRSVLLGSCFQERACGGQDWRHIELVLRKFLRWLSQQEGPSDTMIRKGVCVQRAGILTWTNQGHDVYMAKVSQKHNATKVDKSANLGYYELASGGVAKRLVLSTSFSTPVASFLLSRRCFRVSVLY